MMIRKVILGLCLILAQGTLSAQVGIETDSPDASAILDVESTDKGFLPPRMTTTERDGINGGSPAEGLVIYNTDENCLEVYNGTDWDNLCNQSTAAMVTTLDCAGATQTGTLTDNVLASGVSFDVAYTGGNGGDYSGEAVASTGVTGLTATLAAGTLASGNGNVTYTISGTPSGSGTASFAISLGGQSCTVNLTVDPAPPTVAGLDCAGATQTGTLTDNVLASGVSFDVAYTGGNGGDYSGEAVASTGVTGLTATLAAGTLASGNGNVTYTISGTPSGSGTASFAISLGGIDCEVNLTVDALPATVTALGGPGCTGEGVITETLVVGEDVSTNGISMILYAQVATPGDWSYTATAREDLSNNNPDVEFTGSGTFTSAGCHRIELAGSGVPASQEVTFTGRWDTNTSPNGVARINIIQPSQVGIPAGIVLGNTTEFYHSVNDSDYAPFTDPTAPADITTVNADGTNESITLDRQGVIRSRNILIPVVSITIDPNTSVPFAEQRRTITIPAEYTEDGVPGEVILKLGGGNLSGINLTPTNEFYITAELIVPTDINLKKLDVNSGLGADLLGLLVGSFEFPASSAGTTTATIELRDHPGVPGNADATNLYLPVMSLNERIWLNNNIGANYTEVGNAAFNPQQQATPNGVDPNAYGDYFQWSRRPDGHEDPSSTITSTQLTGTQPNSDQFVSCTFCNGKWTSSFSTVGQWSGVTAANNPCPSGFRVPNEAEFNAETDTWLNINSVYAGENIKLRLPRNGFRAGPDGSFSLQGDNVNLWSSDGENVTMGGTNGFGLRLSPTGFSTTNRPGSVLSIQFEYYGFGVRCIKD